MTKVSISSIFNLLNLNKFHTLSFQDNNLTFDGSHRVCIQFNDIDSFKEEKGFIWNRFIVKLNNQKTYNLGGFRKKESNKFYAAFIKEYAEYYYRNQYKKAQNILALYPAPDLYFQKRKFDTLVSEVKKTMSDFSFLDEPEDPKYTKGLLTIQDLLNKDSKLIEKHNKDFLEEELKTYNEFFQNIEKNPLTAKQREAVIVNEQANLIIAGAGSGKTSVMIARVGYVMQKYGLTPNEIVIMAFGSDAAKELSERIEERLHLKEDMNVSTFHSFGQSIIAQVEGKKPSLAAWVEDINSKASLVQQILLGLSESDSAFNNVLMQFFAHPFAQYKSEFSFKSKIEYEQYLYENKVVSLKGERVKSYEECEIANFLLLNGINYEYEPFYKHETATEEYRQYQPDFYLTDYDIYLEHFGIDKNNKTAPFVNNEEYLKGMEWKRQIHEQHETTLIETYSYYQQQGRLLHKLEAILKEHEVQLFPKTFQEALKDLPESGFSEFSKTVATFIGHYKSNDHTMQKIRHRAGSDERLNAYLDLFEPTLTEYERKKASMSVIDFDDMINKAIQYVEEGRYKSQFKCILVDEYQDISAARARLIKAICNQVDDSVLTVVGDDWQSIYRFAGSEISLFHHFENYFGYAKTVKLDYTFRYNDKISQVSQKFVEKNPNQIKKEIKTLTQVNHPTVHVWWGDDKDIDQIKTILNSLSVQKDRAPSSVYILGRNRYSFPERMNTLKQHYPQLDIQSLTAHRSKGLEADICIIPGVCSGRLGFPSSIEGDPINELALAEQENFEYAEERRLFYVALTRAKDEVHILASNVNVSPFAKELEEDKYEVIHHYKDNIKPQVCPGCEIGTLVKRNANGRTFWGCSNYSTLGCKYTAKIHYCKEKNCNGIMQYDSDKNIYICSNENCKIEEKACPDCKGKLELRFNSRQNNRPFLGCSNFSDKEIRCRYTEPI
jgi:DNA helicase IV